MKVKLMKLPLAYQEVEYIESSGTQYIDTGVSPDNDTGLKVIFSDLTVDTRDFNFIGSRLQGSSRFMINYTDGNFGYGWDGYYTTNENMNVSIKNTAELNFYNNRHFVANGNTLDNLSTIAISNMPTIYIFGQHSQTNNLYSYKVYECEITQDNLLIRKFIPCYRKSDSVIGLYETTSKNLFDYASQTWTTGLLLNTGIVNDRNTNYKTTDFIDILDAGKTYTIGFNQMFTSSNGTSNRIAFYDENQDFISIEPDWDVQYTQIQRYTRTIIVPTGTKYIRYSVRNTDEDLQIELGDIATAYKPFPFYTNAGTGTFTKGNNVSSFMTARVSTVKRTQNLLRLSRTEWNTDSKNPTDSVVFDYNKLYYMASSGYIRPNPGTLNETITRTLVEYTQTSSSWWGIGYPIEVKPNTKYTISAKRLEGANTKINYSLYDADGNFRDYAQVSSDTNNLSPTNTITTGANDKTLIISVVGITTGATVYAYDIQVEEGQTKTDFRPYIEYQRHNVKTYTYEGGEDLNFTGMDANGNLEGSQAYNGTTVKYAVGKANIAFDGTTETISYTNCNGFNASYYGVTDADISRSYENSTSEANRIVNTSLVIPNTHQGLPVTDILPKAFYGGDYGGSGQHQYYYQGYFLLNIKLGNNIKVLHNNCFGGCRAAIDLKNVEYIANYSLGYIGQSGKVYTVIDEVEFPTSVRYIEYSPFTKTTQLTIRSNITQPATTIDTGGSISGGIYDGNSIDTVIFTAEVTEVSGRLFGLVTSVLKFLHTNNDSIDLSGITSQKTAMATTIYTDNNYIHSFDWASKNITPTFYHLDGTAWE